MEATRKDKKKHYLRKEKKIVSEAIWSKTTQRETDKNNTTLTHSLPIGGNVPGRRKRLQFPEATLLVTRCGPGWKQYLRY